MSHFSQTVNNNSYAKSPKPEAQHAANENSAAPDMSILQGDKSQYPDFPLDIFPRDIQNWIRTEATLNSCCVSYVVGGLLSSMASLIGTTRQAKVHTYPFNSGLV